MHVIYARVSTEEQAKTGYGINSQLEACRSKFHEMKISVGKEYIDDGYSGEFIDRPEMDQLIDNTTATKQINDLNREIATINISLSNLSMIQNKNMPAEIPINDILQATTFEERKSIMLRFGYKIFAVKTDDHFEFWFER